MSESREVVVVGGGIAGCARRGISLSEGSTSSVETHSVAVLNSTRWPARHARIPKAIEICVLPAPGRHRRGPSICT